MQKAACVLTAACFISSGWLLVRGASGSAWKTQGKVFRSLQLALSFQAGCLEAAKALIFKVCKCLGDRESPRRCPACWCPPPGDRSLHFPIEATWGSRSVPSSMSFFFFFWEKKTWQSQDHDSQLFLRVEQS